MELDAQLSTEPGYSRPEQGRFRLATKRLTISDIARFAGVSKGTVSRVINGRDGVGAETRDRVLALMREMGFEASYFAQNLAGRRSWTVGVVFPFIPSELFANPVYPELLGGIGDELAVAGYSLSVLTMSADSPYELLQRDIARGRVDGVILPAAREGDDLLELLIDADVPTVLVGHRAADPNAVWVDCDSDRALAELTTELLEQGHRRLALINGPRDVQACRLREEGFQRAAERYADAHVRSFYGEFSAEHGYATARQALDAPADERPTAILAGSDLIAGGCLGAARERGIEVGADLAVTGFDDDRLAPLMHPPLTSVRMPLLEMGRAAAERLMALINGEAPGESVVLSTNVVWRESAARRSGESDRAQ
jgi:LacI family transcriptional regulator